MLCDRAGIPRTKKRVGNETNPNLAVFSFCAFSLVQAKDVSPQEPSTEVKASAQEIDAILFADQTVAS